MSLVKKILKILYTCLKKKVYYVFLFLKVSQCKFKQKETILCQETPSKASQNSPNQKSAGVLPSAPLPGLYTEPTGGLLTLGRIFSPSIILKSPSIKICSENTVVSEEKIFFKFHLPFFLFLAWRPSWLEVVITGHTFGRGSSKDHSTQVWLQLAQWFLRRRLKCEMLTNGRQTTDEK